MTGSRTGLHFEPHPGWQDVWVDGSLVGTVHVVAGGWAFYAAGRARSAGFLPAAVGPTRDETVQVGLRTA